MSEIWIYKYINIFYIIYYYLKTCLNEIHVHSMDLPIGIRVARLCLLGLSLV